MVLTVTLTDDQVCGLLEACDHFLMHNNFHPDVAEAWGILMDTLAEVTALCMPPNEELELLYPPDRFKRIDDQVERLR